MTHTDRHSGMPSTRLTARASPMTGQWTGSSGRPSTIPGEWVEHVKNGRSRCGPAVACGPGVPHYVGPSVSRTDGEVPTMGYEPLDPSDAMTQSAKGNVRLELLTVWDRRTVVHASRLGLLAAMVGLTTAACGSSGCHTSVLRGDCAHAAGLVAHADVSSDSPLRNGDRTTATVGASIVVALQGRKSVDACPPGIGRTGKLRRGPLSNGQIAFTATAPGLVVLVGDGSRVTGACKVSDLSPFHVEVEVLEP